MINILMHPVSGRDFVDIFLSEFCLIFVILLVIRYAHYNNHSNTFCIG